LLFFKEAITNISKHSNATTVLITLKEHSAFYQLLIHDNGQVPVDNNPVGMGITNMEERVEALGGHFNLATDNGFKIFISIPKAGITR
jgi:signal transduction histidine kinase